MIARLSAIARNRSVLYAALFAVIFFPFYSHTIFFRDSFILFGPNKYLIGQALRHLTIQTWNPSIYLGMPFVADPLAGWFYPGNLIYAALPFAAANKLFILLHYPLAARFMDKFLENRGASRAACLTGGLAFALSGYLLCQHANPVYLIGPAWAPLALYFFDRSLEDGSRWAVAAGMVLALQVLGGEPQSAAVTGAILAVIATANLRRRPRRALGGLALAAATAVPLALVQVLPTAELYALSVREGGISLARATVFSFHPGRLAELVWPSPFGTLWPEYHYFGGAMMGDDFVKLPWAMSNYLGLPLLGLAGVALAGKRRRLAAAVIALALGFLALSLGRHFPAYELVYRIVPFFDRFRYPEKFMAWFAGAVAVAAALGLDALKQKLTERPREVMIGAAVFMVLVTTAVALSALVWPGVIAGLTGLPAGSPPLAFASANLIHGGKQVIMVCLIAGLALMIGARRGSPRLTVPLLLTVMVIDWWFASVAIMPAGPPDIYDFTPQAAAAVQKDRAGRIDHYRFHRLLMDFHDSNPALDQYPILARMCIWERNTLRSDLHAMLGFEEFAGYNAAMLKQGLDYTLDRVEIPQFQLYNVAYLISGYEARDLPPVKAETIFADGNADLRVLRLADPMPRAYWVPAALPAADEEGARKLFESIDPRRAVVIMTEGEGKDEGSPPGELVPAEVDYESPERARVTVRAPAAGWLVLNDRFYPGWSANLDGRPAEMFRANIMVRAVRVPAGNHEVVFTYRSQPLQLGAAISGPAWLLALVFVLWPRRRRSLSPAAGDQPLPP